MVRKWSLHPRFSDSPKDRNGVSLLEVMVATTLAIVMMGAIWSLANLLTRRHETQIRLAEQCQITRSLQQRLTQDLNSLVSWDQQPTPASEPSVTEGEIFLPAFPFYLFDSIRMADGAQSSTVATLTGTETELSLHVYVDPLELAWGMYQVDDQGLAEDAAVDVEGVRPSLTRRVRYSLVRPQSREGSLTSESANMDWNMADEEEFQAQTGFNREEWNDVAGRNVSSRRSTDFDTRFNLRPASNSSSDDQFFESSESGPSRGYRNERIEEIADAQFRYFDGRRWRRSWNSLQNGRLPQAILFQFSFAPKKTRNDEQEFDLFPEFPEDNRREAEIEDEFEDEFNDLEFGELPTDERFEFAFLLRIQTSIATPRQSSLPGSLGVDTAPELPWGTQQ